MGDWFVRLPMYNLELPAEVTVGEVVLRPVGSYEDHRKRIASVQHTETPFVHTADAVVQLGDLSGVPASPFEDAWDRFWHVHQALRFLQQRDFRVSEWSLHREPRCIDPPERQGWHMAICNVPYNPKIQVAYSQWADAIQCAARLWQDDETDSRTGFRYAIALQHASLDERLPVELRFLSQWIALESLSQRWVAGPDAHVRIEHKVSSIDQQFHPFVRDALQPYVDQGMLNDEEADELARAVRKSVFSKAWNRTAGFLQAIGVGDVSGSWLRRCLCIRNGLAHGRRLSAIYAVWPDVADAPQDLSWRAKRLNDIVSRFIMSLMGYEPDSWNFEEGTVGWYRRRQNVLPDSVP
ncbi:MAG: hypothetical protein AB7Y46_12730 [Armatimonadota bacterium]